jgi:tRNA nucleotidyltransferase (CCA-adding enzyme)
MAGKRLIDTLITTGQMDLQPHLARFAAPATRALLHAVAAEAQALGFALYIVGGFVRDLLLGRPSQDLDLVVEGDAIRLGRTLVKRYGGRLVSHAPFGTAVWYLPENQTDFFRKLSIPVKNSSFTLPRFVDLISARRETYSRSGALPDVHFASIREDQLRRDFTINALAIRLNGFYTGHLLDPGRGLQDLRDRKIRVLHPRSFKDDPTRMFRTVRYATRLKFTIEPATLKQLKSFLRYLANVSPDRLRNETELVMLEEDRVQILQTLQRLGVLKSVHPALRLQPAAAKALKKIPQKIEPHWEPVSNADLGLVLWLMHLSPREVGQIADRLRFPLSVRSAAESAARLRNAAAGLKKLPASRLVGALESEPLLAVYALFLVNQSNAFGKKLLRYARQWRHIRPHLSGDDLRKMGLTPGPAYKRILEQTRAAWLDGKIKNVQQERKLIKKLAGEYY